MQWVLAALGTLVGLGAVAAVVTAVVLVLATGGDSEGSADASPGERWLTASVDPNAPYLPTLANAEFAAGPNRVSFTVTDQRGLSVGDLLVSVTLFDLRTLTREQSPVAVTTVAAEFIDYAGVTPVPGEHTHADGSSVSDHAHFVGVGVYVARIDLPTAGLWGLEFLIGDGEGDVEEVLFRLEARAESAAPNLGEPAIGLRTPTLADAPIERLTSDEAPEPGLYQWSLDEALARPRPLVLIFSTPGYCHSRTCGPSLEVVKAVWREHVGRLDALHIEVFANPDEPEDLREAAAFDAWSLPSEPWIFVIDGAGRIFSRYEGTITASELQRDVAALLQADGS